MVFECFTFLFQAFSKAHQGCILLKHKKLKEILPLDADSAFGLEYNPVMLGYAQHLQEIDGSSDTVLQGKVKTCIQTCQRALFNLFFLGDNYL